MLAAPAGAADPPAGPVLLVPPRPDSTRIDSPPAPLLIPGRPGAADSLRKTRTQVAREHFDKARSFEASGNPQAAVVEYQNAIGLDPTLPGAHQRLGEMYDAFGALTRAVAAYSAELQNHPDNRIAARKLGVALIRVGETERGVQQLELIARRAPRDGETWRALGFAYSHARRFADAERALRTAIRLPPADAEEHRDLGVLLANLGRASEARVAYREAARLDPRDGGVWINLGNLDARAGRPMDAIANYRTAESRDSLNSLAYRGQVQAYTELGRDEDVAATYRRWLRSAAHDYNARLEAVQWFAARDRVDVAMELAREGLRLDPRSSDAHLVMGVAWGAAGDARTALLEFRRAEFLLGSAGDPSQLFGLIAELRAGAPDSLRRLFAADSLAAMERARADSMRVPGFSGPRIGRP